MTVIVDYDTGNLASIQNMLKKIGHESTVSNKVADLKSASRIILPGVGAFDYGMKRLQELDLITVLKEKALEERVPMLGICLGAQLCCKSSEEGVLPGLGLVDAHVRKFPTQSNGRKFFVPHMGWDPVLPAKQSKLFSDLTDPRFYFVHSYFIQCTNPSDVLAANSYSCTYNSAFESGQILGVQFHPEKSHNFGKQLLKNFVEKY